VRRTRQMGEKISTEDSYYLSSLTLSTGAQALAKATLNKPWPKSTLLR